LARFESELEIQRRAVAIAIRRMDMQQSEVALAPKDDNLPGRVAVPFGPSAAANLLGALNAYRETQDNLMRACLNHYVARIRLFRDIGAIDVEDDTFCAFELMR
jgi:hypothetical protein